MPTTDQNGDSNPVSAWPVQMLSCHSSGGTSALAGAVDAYSVIFCVSPS